MLSFSCIGPDDVPRLRDEHSFLERQLIEVLRLATADHRKDCEVSWEVFVRDLELHMKYEENLVFPSFVKMGTDEQLSADLFRAEHEQLRSLCRSLGRQFEQLTLNPGLLRELAEKLMVHKEREGLALYPWLGSLAQPRLAWEIMRLIVTPSELQGQEIHSYHVPRHDGIPGVEPPSPRAD